MTLFIATRQEELHLYRFMKVERITIIAVKLPRGLFTSGRKTVLVRVVYASGKKTFVSASQVPGTKVRNNNNPSLCVPFNGLICLVGNIMMNPT